MMSWICGVVRERDGHMWLQVQTGESEVRLQSVRDWRSDSQKVRRVSATNVDIDFQNFRRVDLTNYVRGLGTPWLQTEAQTGFEATAAGMSIVIPSQLMIMSLFGSAVELRCSLMAPLQTDQWLTGPMPYGQVIAQVGGYRARSLSTAARGQWIATDRSVSAAFGSVYRHALDGRFDLSLPAGLGTFDLVGRLVNGTLLVTKLTLLAVLTGQVDGDSSLNDVRHHYFHKRSDPVVATTKGSTPSEDARLRFTTFIKLTDVQWLRAQTVLAEMPGNKGAPFVDVRRPCALRDCLDTIRFKFGSPCTWKDVEGKASTNHAYWIQRRIVRAGLWDRLVDAIS